MVDSRPKVSRRMVRSSADCGEAVESPTPRPGVGVLAWSREGEV